MDNAIEFTPRADDQQEQVAIDMATAAPICRRSFGNPEFATTTGIQKMAKKEVETALILRTCEADMKSHSDFQWPSEVGAVVEAPDWLMLGDAVAKGIAKARASTALQGEGEKP